MKKHGGITLIALIITVIVLLILAGVTISTLTGENGLLSKAGDAKSQSEIAEEKDIISISAIQAQAENKQGNLEENKFSEALYTNSKTGNKASIIASDIGSFTVKFESNRYYEVDKNGNIGYIENVTGEKTLTVQCVNSKNEVLEEYEYIIVTNNYSKTPPSIDKYESAEERVEGEITEDKTIQVLYYLICNDDTTLVFTGLDSNGNITSNEDEIVSYMVGDGEKNSLLENTIKCIIRIPDNYNNKPVTKIGYLAFYRCNNVKEVFISDSIITIAGSAFHTVSMEKLVLGKNVLNFGTGSFWVCSNLTDVTFKNMNFNGHAFGLCNNFKNIIIDKELEDTYKVVDSVIYSKNGDTLYYCAEGKTGTFTIPSTVTTIREGAFYRTYLEKIIIPDNVISVSSHSIAETASLKELYIGSGLTTINSSTFWHLFSIEKVILDNENIVKNITEVKSFGYLLENPTTIYIKNNITEIGSFITNNFQITESDKEGYVKYVKN